MSVDIPRLPAIGDRATLGHQIADWIECHLPHGPGDVAGEPIELDLEFLTFIHWVYSVKDDGRRIFRRAVFSRPKGRAKSELAGMLMCVEAIGPARFDHWAEPGEVSDWGYPYETGEPVGVPVRSPFIRCLATEEGQSGNTYDNVYEMLGCDAITEAYPGIDVGLTRIFLPGGGELTPSTASSAAKDGGKETGGTADETHLYRTDELRRMHQTVSRNMAKRRGADPWMLETTTAYAPGENSVAEAAREYALKLGTLDEMIEAGFLYDHREAPQLSRQGWASDKKLREALIDVYGAAAGWMDIPRIIEEIRDPVASKADSQRYWLNQVATEEGRWMDLGPFKALEVERVLKNRMLLAAGFDGSRFSDSTAIVTVTKDGFISPWKTWSKPSGIDDWQVDEDEVAEAIEDLYARYKIVRMYCDPFYWEETVSGWVSKYRTVREWRTNRTTQMVHAIHGFETAVRSGAITHSGGIITEHVGNAVKKATNVNLDERGTKGHVITKDNPRSPRKIDVAVASVLAVEAWQDAIGEGEFKAKRRRGRTW